MPFDDDLMLRRINADFHGCLFTPIHCIYGFRGEHNPPSSSISLTFLDSFMSNPPINYIVIIITVIENSKLHIINMG